MCWTAFGLDVGEHFLRALVGRGEFDHGDDFFVVEVVEAEEEELGALAERALVVAAVEAFAAFFVFFLLLHFLLAARLFLGVELALDAGHVAGVRS